jgi:uncharacterized integral membrane protein
MIWTAVATALALVLLIVFILQSQHRVQVRFFGLEGTVALGMAVFIAAVAGGVLVSVVLPGSFSCGPSPTGGA